MALGSIVIGRWSASKHYFGAVRDECSAAGACIYRIALGRPLWFLGLGQMTEGIERRVPDVVARAPGSDKPKKRSGTFDGYTVVGSLPPGGSGAKLYVAEPDAHKRAAFEALGRHGIGQVIIKHFSLHEGSSLPQIVRESRALEAAKNIGLVLEHDLTEERFFYVMPYVPGDDLSTAIRRLHEQSSAGGLDADKLREGLTYAADLTSTLARYHRGGLWHKDVKPDNIIVYDGHAHLVDLGLVTPLRSAMTLTTHGTEYFRDPELVRMALRGVKVHQVSGEKFDVYAAGAVLYSIIENSFPAHGGLSQISKRCPEGLRWIVRRAMAEYDKRYATAGEMLDDLKAALAAPSLADFKPADLPSMRGPSENFVPETPVDELADFVPPAAVAARTPVPPAAGVAAAQAGGAEASRRPSPSLNLVNWWTGKYEEVKSTVQRAIDDAESMANESGTVIGVGFGVGGKAKKPVVETPRHNPLPLERRDSAQEQLRRARERVNARRAGAAKRMRGRHHRPAERRNGVGRAALTFFALFGVMLAGGLVVKGLTEKSTTHLVLDDSGSDMKTELTHIGDDFSVFADSALGMLRVTEADGRTFELSVDPDLIRSAAKNWPEMAGQFRETLVNRVMPAVLAAQNSDGTPAMIGESWLLIDQLGAGTSDKDRQTVLKKLSATGVYWVTADSEEGLELVSQAMAEIGIGTPADPRTEARLREFLASTPDLTGVVWLINDSAPKAVVFSTDAPSERLMTKRLRG